jgi:hypothetical protein
LLSIGKVTGRITMKKQIPITGIPAHAEFHEFIEESWHKGFIIRNQTTIRLRRHHLELIQAIAKQVPLYLPRKMDLTRREFGHAGILIRTLARIQLRDQLVECNAPPAIFQKQQPTNSAEIFACCFQTAMRCEADLDLDRLRDTLLDILMLPYDRIVHSLDQDAEFEKDDQRMLEQWSPSLLMLRM